MHPKLTTEVAGIYARFSSEMQREASIEDPIRRGRDLIACAHPEGHAAVELCKERRRGA